MLKYGVLGLLSYGDMTGYEIMSIFRDSLAFFWNASTSQIYRELQHLEDGGLATSCVQEQDGRPNRRVYSITEAGRGELSCWLDCGEDGALSDMGGVADHARYHAGLGVSLCRGPARRTSSSWRGARPSHRGTCRPHGPRTSYPSGGGRAGEETIAPHGVRAMLPVG